MRLLLGRPARVRLLEGRFILSKLESRFVCRSDNFSCRQVWGVTEHRQTEGLSTVSEFGEGAASTWEVHETLFV